MNRLVVGISAGTLLMLESAHSFVPSLSCHPITARRCPYIVSCRQSQLFSSSNNSGEEGEEEIASEPPIILDEEGVTDDDTLLMQAVDENGALPGGLSPDQMMGLVQNPEVVELLKSPKMQDAMALMMTKGPEELKQALDDDPELLEIVGKLNAVLGGPPPSS